jgi:hypothetical protein
MDNILRSGQLDTFWGITQRHTLNIIAELEGLGFVFKPDYYGARQIPLEVATAVRDLRTKEKPLSELLLRADLEAFRGSEMDTLEVLIENRAELAVLRETVGAVWKSLQGGSPIPQLDWRSLGLPSAREQL